MHRTIVIFFILVVSISLALPETSARASDSDEVKVLRSQVDRLQQTVEHLQQTNKSRHKRRKSRRYSGNKLIVWPPRSTLP